MIIEFASIEFLCLNFYFVKFEGRRLYGLSYAISYQEKSVFLGLLNLNQFWKYNNFLQIKQ